MKCIASLLLLIVLTSPLQAQRTLAGSWICALDQQQGYDNETIIFTEDGYYHVTLSYLNGQEYGINPTEFLGRYTFDGSNLQMYDLVNNTNRSFPITNLSAHGFALYNDETGQNYTYHFQGPARLDPTQRADLLSWENYRRLGGTWQSSTSILKIIPTLGIVIIRVPGDPNFFHWGHYSIEENQISIKEISAEETVFYVGGISAFAQQTFTLTSAGEAEHFKYTGSIQLDPSETMMVNQYMQMTHRLNMSIIDMMDGVQNYTWREVDEHGNIRY